ncbi:MAG TPA: NAD+ synthase [bacterium]|nr:NAD+ synthase [bacterium]
MRIAMVQINAIVGDIEGNTRRICEGMEAAAEGGADLVAFPELAVTGYPPEDLLLKPDFVTANREALGEIARRTPTLTAVVGFVDADDALYNAAAVLADGRLVGVYRKHRLPNYGVFDEKRYFRPGRDCPLFLLDGLPVAVTICEDIWAHGGPCQAAAQAGGLLLVNINASPYHAGRWRAREELLRTRARDYTVAVAYVNLVGGQDELVFDGMSLVVDHSGAVLARGPQMREGLVWSEVDLEEVRRFRRYNPIHVIEDLPGEEIPTPTIAIPHPARRGAPQPATMVPPLERLEEIYQALVLGTRDYARKNRFREVLLGLSGGIDSALVAAIAADAIGPEHVHVAVLPSQFTSGESRRLAAEVAANLGLRVIEAGIDAPFAALIDALQPTFAGREEDVTEENVQARIRGTMLMALSNKFGWLVLTTGNKSELSVGYATLYGDMAGGFAVIKDVPKSLVYELARWRNRRGAVIPEEILTRPPTAELRHGQRDTDTLPPYEVLDPILELYVERDAPPARIIERGFDPAVVAKVVAMVDRSEYKRRQAPPGIKITPKAFGRDRRLPITNWYRGTTPAPAARPFEATAAPSPEGGHAQSS